MLVSRNKPMLYGSKGFEMSGIVKAVSIKELEW